MLIVIGFALLGPGFALYWRALRGLDATAAGILGLNEALVASVLGAVLFASAFTAATVIAALLVGAAVALELRGRGGELSRLAGA